MRRCTGAIVLVWLAVSGCGGGSRSRPAPPEDTARTNRVREALGIRQIRKGWTFSGRAFGAEDWASGGLPCKRVQRGSDDEILWEEDYYYTGMTYTDPDGGTCWEFVTVHYDYGTKRFYLHYSGPNPRIAGRVESLDLTDRGYAGETDEGTLQVADELLGRLGMGRP